MLSIECRIESASPGLAWQKGETDCLIFALLVYEV